MISDTIARASMAAVFGGIAFVLTVNADCSGFPEQPCEGILGTTMPQVDRLHSVLWIAAAAAFGWLVFSTINRVKILVTTLLGGVAGFSIAVGATVLYFERKTANRDPAIANSSEGFLFIVAFVLAWRRWAGRSTDSETAKTGDAELP